MKELKCQNCNSRDLEYMGGIWVCQNCGSKFIPEKNEIPKESKEAKLTEKLVKAYNELIEIIDPLSSKYEKCEKRVNSLLDEIRSINPNNPHMLTISVFDRIGWGIKSKEIADDIVDMAERALKYAKPDEKEEITESLGRNMKYHKGKMASMDPELEPRIDEVLRQCGCGDSG